MESASGGEQERTTAAMAGDERSVILVEDDAAMRKAIERLLRAAGFRSVQSFASAEALLGTQAANVATCLVFDIHLPGISGIELRRRLSDAGCRAPVVFITAHDDPALRQEAELLGCIGYFRKPFEGYQLLEVVRQALKT